MFKKYHSLLVDETNVTTLIRSVNKSVRHGVTQMYVSNCGWAKAPYAWFVGVRLTDKEYWRVLETLAKEGLHLLSETVGY